MEPPSKISLLSFSLAIICLAPLCSSSRELKHDPLKLKYHNGPVLKGNVSLSLFWYGPFEPTEKNVVRSFIKSLGYVSPSLKPDVGSWWKHVESYSKQRVRVRIGGEVEENRTLGFTVTTKNLPILLEMAKAKGRGADIFVVFVSKEFHADDVCEASCYIRGVLGKQLYIVVHNPEIDCPGKCAVPFHIPEIEVGPPVALAFEPPSRNIGADAMLINFASALAEAVTNPSNTGFYAEKSLKSGKKAVVGAAKACVGLFAKGGFPGYPGNIRIDPKSGGAFNAHGVNGTKFLLPALWDIKTSSCWTVL